VSTSNGAQGTYTGLPTLVARSSTPTGRRSGSRARPRRGPLQQPVLGPGAGHGGSTALAIPTSREERRAQSARAMLSRRLREKWGCCLASPVRKVVHQKGKLTSASLQPMPQTSRCRGGCAQGPEGLRLHRSPARTDERAKSDGARSHAGREAAGPATAVVAGIPSASARSSRASDAARAKAIRAWSTCRLLHPATNGSQCSPGTTGARRKRPRRAHRGVGRNRRFRLGSAEIMAEYKKLAVTRDRGAQGRRVEALSRSAEDARGAYRVPVPRDASMGR